MGRAWWRSCAATILTRCDAPWWRSSRVQLGQACVIAHRQAYRLWTGLRCSCRRGSFCESFIKQCSFAGLLLLSLLLPKGFKLHHTGRNQFNTWRSSVA